ncbi:MAG: sulfite exporter TauE/SafE family protein [Saprospiraceae bacterium]|nr:sulfite exporter TauE/SafE family protein [Saprospiraceae bacterium]
MIYLALTLGFFGSLHCIGMCGPIALGVSNIGYESGRNQFLTTIQYNFGRVVTYAMLGLLFGIIGQTIVLAGMQKVFSFLAGILLILLFLLSLDFEQFLSRIKVFKRGLSGLSSLISRLTSNNLMKKPFVFGMANGILPCGLVYLAIAGSLASGGIYQGMIFMTLFGLGTIPALLALMLGSGLIGPKIRSGFRKFLPYVQLIMGIYLIYRGVVVDMPDQLDFYTALKNPIMCH